MTDVMSLSERIGRYFTRFPMFVYIIFFTIIAIVMIIYIIKFESKMRLYSELKKEVIKINEPTKDITFRQTLLTIAIIISVATVIASATVWTGLWRAYGEAYKHGYREALNVNSESLWDSIRLSPRENEVPSNDDSKIIVFYKFACPDCEAIYKDLELEMRNYGSYINVYYVAGKSAQGKKLLEKYPIDKVPTAVYVKNDGSYLSYLLYKKDADGNSVLNTEKLDELNKAVSQDKAR